MKKILIILLCIFLAACEHSVLSEKDSGKIINLSQGEDFKIDLAENPTTGYVWEFLTEPKTTNIVRQINSEYIARKGPMLGAGGRKVFTYTATNKGTVELHGFYKRSYENALVLDAMGKANIRYIIVVR